MVFMFQNSRPALSNCFQSASSRTSAWSSEIPSVTLRTLRSNPERSFAAAPVCQQAQSGSGPDAECGNKTCALLFAARSLKNRNQSDVKNGISQLTIRFHSCLSAFVAESSSPVMIPPSGPSPGQLSSITSAPNATYLPGTTTIFTCFVTPRSSSIMRSSLGFPPTSTSALSRPNRVLPPPASTYPATSLEVVVDSRVPVIPPPAVLYQAAESPARAISPANFDGAAQLSRQFARRSSDARRVACSNKPLQISVWPHENPVRQFRCRFRRHGV